MITIPALKVRQFGVEFYQATFTAANISRLVKFEVLTYTPVASGDGKKKARSRSRINWELLENRISGSEGAFQRPVIHRKIEELLKYYQDCRDIGNLPAIPGAVIMIAENRLDFKRSGTDAHLGMLQIPEEAGILRALDGQHRLLALHSAGDGGLEGIDVPLNPSHIISLAGRRLYSDEKLALAHDIIKALNQDETSPLAGQIRILGVGKGKVSQASLAEEIVDLLENMEKIGGPAKSREFQVSARRFFLNYMKAIASTFSTAWNGNKYSIRTGAALRAFLRVAPDVMARAREVKGDPYDLHSLREALRPWGHRLGDKRFETEGEWREKLAGGTRGTVDFLARECRASLR
ncbi:MAG: hypothetical protein HYY65_03765 [Candidatus Tectomicrobia bacterium]|uniref:DGQHR domain-containing protein n=1 Tax=Tectimicrobiota bacterium TaxID=2528274 RepID=A0A932GN98_UNCTE|nr:hypothetical protein [Candidatus Tectomicrobia bacterium]